jgi:hypothetical protein
MATQDGHPIITLEEASTAIRALNQITPRVGGALTRHIEWAKSALWAAAGPGNVALDLLGEVDGSAEQVG